MCVVARKQLDEWFDDEMDELDRDLREGRITEKQYNDYSRNIRQQYQDDIEDLKNEI